MMDIKSNLIQIFSFHRFLNFHCRNNFTVKYFIITCLFIPTISSAQLSKHWEFYTESRNNIPPSFNANDNTHLKTISLNDGSFVTLASREKENVDFGSQILLFKFNTEGEIVWEYIYEDSLSVSEYPLDISIDLEGNILVAGRVITFFQQGYGFPIQFSNYLLFKITPDAELVWTKEIEGADYFFNYCKSIATDSLGYIYTIGKIDQNNESGTIVNKLDMQGNEIWKKDINQYRPINIEIIGDEIYALTYPFNLYRLNFEGEMIDSFSVDIDHFRRFKFDQEGNIYRMPGHEFTIEKYSPTGSLLWTYHKETNLPSNVIADESTDCFIDDQGNVYITGRYYGDYYGNPLLYSNCDILTTKLDSEGNVIWENIYKYDNINSCQVGKRIQYDGVGNTYVLGYQTVEINGDVFASDDMVALIYNNEGTITDSIYHNGIANKDDFGIDFFLRDNDIYIMGYSQNNEDLIDFNVVKFSTTTSTTSIVKNLDKIVIYPNPTEGILYLKHNLNLSNIRIFDTYGQVVYEKDVIINTNFKIDLSGRASGMYYLTYLLNNKMHNEKIIVTDN